MVDRVTPTKRPVGNPNFTAGHEKIGGRRAGTPNKFTTAIKDAALLAAEMHGSDGKGTDALLGFMQHLLIKDIKTFAQFLLKILPVQIAGDAERPMVVTLDVAAMKSLAERNPKPAEVLREVVRQLTSAGLSFPEALVDSSTDVDAQQYAKLIDYDTRTEGEA